MIILFNYPISFLSQPLQITESDMLHHLTWLNTPDNLSTPPHTHT